MVTLRLTLLGGFDARFASGAAVSLPTKKAQALLAYLGLRPGQPHQRDKLAALLWGERSDRLARDGLRHALAALRKALIDTKPPLLLVEGQTLALNPAAVEVDVVTFERRVGEGSPDALEQAAELYRGDLLLGSSVSEPLFEDWLVAERERLREMVLEVLARLLAHQTKTAATERAIQTAVRLLGLDPLQEAVHRTLMRLYARQGRRGAALRQYQVCMVALQRELGAEPEAETKALYQELLRRSAAATRAPGLEGEDRTRPARLAARARVEFPAADTPLFGRAAELARLRELLEEAIRGHGHVVTVLGEAGIGKTRLLGALAAEALDRDCRVLVGRCHESDAILPFGPWVDACRAGEVGANEEALDTLSPAWRAELSRLLPDVATPGLPPPGDSDLRLFESVAQLVEHLAARRPVVLLLEDLQWADEMSLRLLAFVSRRVRGWAALVVATAREEELAEAAMARRTLRELAGQADTVPLALLPLSRLDTTCLVQTLARAGTEAREVARLDAQVWAVSEGNPFAAVETARALQEGTALPDPQTLPLPQRVRELILGRLERLSARARDLASVAAVIGREFDFSLLQRAAGLDEDATAEAVEELVRRHVLRGVGDRFDFSHHRIHAAVYERLLPPQRRLRHRQVGEALAALHAGNLEPHALSLGVHFREGEVWDKAVDCFRQAGSWATARSASREAVACFGQALGALQHIRESPETSRLGIDLRLDLQSGYVLLGELPGMLASLREAESLAQALGDGRRLARVWAHMVACLWWMGEIESAVDYGQRALAMATDLGDLGLEILARARLALTYLYLGEYRQVIDVGRPCTEALRGDLARDRFEMAALPAVMVRGYLAISLASLGDFIAASAVSEEALEIATAANHPYSVVLARSHEGRCRALQGDFSEAILSLESSLDACRREGFYLFSTVAAFLGSACARVGRLAEGIALLEESLERATAIGFMIHRPANLALLAEAYLLSGRLEEALQSAHQALDLSRAGKGRGFEAEALYILGEIQARRDAPDEASAAESYQQALALAEILGMRPLQARCHLALGRMSQHTAKRSAAEEHLKTARTMLAQMDMRFWLEQTTAETRELASRWRSSLTPVPPGDTVDPPDLR